MMLSDAGIVPNNPQRLSRQGSFWGKQAKRKSANSQREFGSAHHGSELLTLTILKVKVNKFRENYRVAADNVSPHLG